MPLVFKSTDPEEEFLSQGFAEDLFTSLKQIKALRLSILGLTATVNGSASAVKQPPAGNATLILTGSMTIQGDRIGVQVRLMQSATDTLVWQGEYQCEREKLFNLRPTIILQICQSLSINLKETERQTIQHLTGMGTGAIELYWKGRYHWRRRGNDLLTSLECFQKAADLDPEFALAHAGIANAAILLGYYRDDPVAGGHHPKSQRGHESLKHRPHIDRRLFFPGLCSPLLRVGLARCRTQFCQGV